MNNPFPAQQQAQQGQYQNQGYLQSPQPTYQSRAGYGPNDPNNGLAHQFSNQDLNALRGGQFARTPSPSQRPRTGGQQGPLPQYGSHLAPPVRNSSPKPAEKEEDPPEKSPDKYSINVDKRGQMAHALVEAFFKENIQRARERNVR